MINTNTLNKTLAAKGFKKGYVAQHLGITPQSLKEKTNNRSEFKLSEVIALKNLLNLNSQEFNDIFLNQEV